MKKYKIKYKTNNEIQELIVDSSFQGKLPQHIISIEEEKNFRIFKKRIDSKKLNLLFYELSLMLKANIHIKDALEILSNNKKDKSILYLLSTMNKLLISNQNINKALDDIKMDYYIKAFLRLSLEGGDISSNIDALSKILNKTIQTRKTFLKAITYPLVLLISFVISFILIFNFVIPKFKIIFSQSIEELPLATKILLETQEIIQEYSFIIFFIFIFLGILINLIYKNSLKIRFFFDKLILKKLFIIKDIYLSMELYRIFLALYIMLEAKYEFHKALKLSKVLSKNNYLLDKINFIDSLLQNGKSIHQAFYETKLFDDIVLNLINTGEISNSINITVKEISEIYKNRFNDKVNFLISLIQPIFLIIFMGLILWIILGIFMPIWDMGSMEQF